MRRGKAALLDDRPERELIDRAEHAILRVRDIQSCSISTDETGKISEVHVVAMTDRSPKLIVRDVETVLKAEVGVDIDYRKIGVVLVSSIGEQDLSASHQAGPDGDLRSGARPPEETVDEHLREMEATPPGSGETPPDIGQPQLELLEADARVRFRGLSVSMSGDSADVSVKLEKSGLEAVGCLSTRRTSAPLCATIAEATLHALMELLDEDFHLCLSEIKELALSGRNAIIAVVDQVEDRTVSSYTGCVFTGRDSNEAAVLAVLDAVNRPLGRWKARTEIHYTIR
jgi:hypothetical protein